MLDPCFVMWYFVLILAGEEKLLLHLSCLHVAVIALFHFLAVLWVSLQSVIVAFPGHTHFLYFIK